MTLEEFGFTIWFQKQIGADVFNTWKPARITAVHKGWCDISDGEETRPAKTTGKLRRIARESKDYLTVGDWVMATNFDGDDFAMIQKVLDRQNTLKRKTAGKEVSHQLIAANIDTAFVVHTLDKGFNLPKLERYLSIVNESGIEPVVLLTKKDLLPAKELKERLAEVAARMPNTPVFAFSNTTGSGLKKVQALFKPGKTYCLIGASGTGKTSLINSLLGEEDLYFTLPVRESDGKGIHTTTWRELIKLDNGALVIDTPGMRELGLVGASDGVKIGFEDLFGLSANCRYANCRHEHEPGCAIRTAVESGELNEDRYLSYIKLKKESEYHEMSYLDKRKKDKAFGRFIKSVKRQMKD